MQLNRSPQEPSAPRTTADRLLTFLPFWWTLAALGQLVYLTGWPMFVYGVPLTGWAAIVVALVRLGIYLGIARGLQERDSAAWGAAVLELGRTAAAFLVAVWTRDWLTGSPLFPAWWVQGLLAGLLPVLVALNVGLASGWRPGPGIELQVRAAASLVAAWNAVTALSLRRRSTAFAVPPHQRFRAMLGTGLPLICVVWLAELLAILAARP